ncbi:MAG TPA: 5'-nucleotidase, lipoprotein e(P4) family [Pyrinomonadaceae bacterium]|nr:5'-nucleotidase, lipoprotein e(P4) family [Pyrinomonadaceae bacterium]
MKIFVSRHARHFSLGVLVTLFCLPVFAQQPADNEYMTGAVLWQQTSGERRALSYQAFALARMILDRDLRTNRNRRMRRAVVVDVDETILDNSRYQGMLLKTRTNYASKTWTEWCNRAEAVALPGAVEFLRYAHSRGVRVFYITNRKEIEKDGTARNLRAVGFPEVTDQTLLVRTDSSAKEPRRAAIAAKYRVVLLMGDNLNDFAEVFENSKTVESRIAATEATKNQFGSRFIVLPNPMYGNWEDAIYGEPAKMTEEEKAAKRKAAIRD